MRLHAAAAKAGLPTAVQATVARSGRRSHQCHYSSERAAGISEESGGWGNGGDVGGPFGMAPTARHFDCCTAEAGRLHVLGQCCALTCGPQVPKRAGCAGSRRLRWWRGAEASPDVFASASGRPASPALLLDGPAGKGATGRPAHGQVLFARAAAADGVPLVSLASTTLVEWWEACQRASGNPTAHGGGGVGLQDRAGFGNNMWTDNPSSGGSTGSRLVRSAACAHEPHARHWTLATHPSPVDVGGEGSSLH